MNSVNYIAVLVAAVAAVVLGGLWYGPIFGKQWMALMGMSQESMSGEKKNMAKSYVLMSLGSLVMAYVLANVIIAMAPYFAIEGIIGAMAGLLIGLCAWVGFIAPVTMGSVLWEGRSWKLWFLNAGYYAVSLAVMGAILAGWV